MRTTLIFLVLNYLLLIIGRLYQFDDSTFLWSHYSTMLPLMWLIAPICIIVFLCRRFRQKWIYIGSTLALHVFMTVWINYIGDISAKFTFGKPAIYPGQGGHFVVVNPPQGQQALIDLIMNYFKQHPFDKNSDEYSAVFYEKSVDSPLSGKRPLAHWWDQSMLTEYQKYQDTGDHEIAVMTFYNKKNDKDLNGITEFWLYNDYAHRCNGEPFEANIVYIKPDGSRRLICD
ncbi:hypothetical protein [Lonsdalea quercina]|uniref:hypothetical protein n=1 Tax=Lonsdalea quercina TaxID=71657 RepID=UPI003976CCA0